MNDKRIFKFSHDTARRLAAAYCMSAPADYICTIQEATRSLDQNSKLWPMLGDIAAQVEWYGRKLTADDWKNVFTASLKKMDVVPNLEGTGFVALGQSTSKMGKREFADLITLIYAFGNERGVIWSECVNGDNNG